MLRRETRLAVFASALILFLILFYQLNIQKNTVQYDAFEDTSMHKSTSYHKNAPGEYHFQPLPSSVINGVDRFVFLLATPEVATVLLPACLMHIRISL